MTIEQAMAMVPASAEAMKKRSGERKHKTAEDAAAKEERAHMAATKQKSCLKVMKKCACQRG